MMRQGGPFEPLSKTLSQRPSLCERLSIVESLAPILTIAGVHLAAVMSPGVAFLIITKNTLRYSWRVGALTALGVGVVSTGYIALGLAGVAAIIAGSGVVFTALTWLGAAYLVVLAIQTILPAVRGQSGIEQPNEVEAAGRDLPAWQAVRGRMLAQLANVTAILYILSVFTSLIAPDTPGGVRVAMAGVMAAISFGWYVLLARLVANPAFRRGYARFERGITMVFGLILIGLAIRIVVR